MADNPYLQSIVSAWGEEGQELDIPDIETEPFPDETLSPGMSTFIRTARRYVAGMADGHEFVDAIQETANDLARYMQLHQQLTPQLQLSFPQQMLAQLVQQALLSFSEGLSEMVASFSQEDLPKVEEGIERCKQSIIVLEAWWLEVAGLVDQEQPWVCPTTGDTHEDNRQVRPGYSADQDFTPVWPAWVELYRLSQDSLGSSEWLRKREELRAEATHLQQILRQLLTWDEPQLHLLYERCFENLTHLKSYLEAMLKEPEENWYLILVTLQSLRRNSQDLRQEMLLLLENLEADLGMEVE
jgi:hypothetical protein